MSSLHYFGGSSRTSRRLARAAKRGGNPALRLETLEQRSLPAVLNQFLTTEHVDLNLGLNASTKAWTLNVNDSDASPPVAHKPEDALLYVGAPALTKRADSSSFDFVGVGPGADFYRLPQSQNQNLIYLGFAGYGVTPSDLDRYNPSTESKSRMLQRSVCQGFAGRCQAFHS